MTDYVPYQLNNGQVFADENMGRLFELIASHTPHYNIQFPWNDIGLGNLYATVYADKSRFCVDNLKWYLYDNGRWSIDKGDIKSQGMMQTLVQMLKFYIDDIKETIDADTYKKYKTYVDKSSADPVVRRALNAAKTNMIINYTDFDANPYLLNCTNGVYDLREHKFRQAIPSDYFTLSTSCPFPVALHINRCDRWYTFIDEITEGNKEKAQFLQRALGYSLLGINKAECMFIAYGQTRCGKGTLFNSIAKVLGSGENGYGGTINSSLVCESKFKDKDYNAPEPMLADTVGVRYLTLSETKSNAVLDETAIKSLTGRDPRKTRQLHSTAFTFTPQFTIWLSTNFLPKVNDDSVFKSDRIWVIEFNKHFDENTRDNDLKELFDTKNAQMTILQWLVDGYRDYSVQGLNPPQCVREATANYARQNDRVLCFKEDCVVDAPGERVSNGALYAKYKAWCMDEERSYTPLGTTSFYKQFAKFYRKVDANGFRGFADVKLKMSEGMVEIKRGE